MIAAVSPKTTKKKKPATDRPIEPSRGRRSLWPLLAAALAVLGGTALAVSLIRKRAEVHLKPAPNVLLISIDTLRADHIGAYGARAPTPAIDELAKEGVLFESAVSHVPITLPSHASMLTGTYPILHGVRDNGAFRLAEDKKTLAETFHAAGYRTGAFVGSFALDSRFGLDQGFEVYDDFYGDTSDFNDFAISERPADAVLAPARGWIGADTSKRWFAFVHLYDPHSPYAPPTAFRGRFASDLYTGEVAYVDDALGRFLADLRRSGSLENTIVVVTSDHGEGRGQHGETTHGMFAYDSTLHVPLVVSWPGALPAGVRVPSRIRLIDLAPTLVELAALSPAADTTYQGESLVSLIRDPASGRPRDSYFEAMAFNLNRNWAPLSGLYRERLKYFELPIPELYDLDGDPGEEKNLAETSPGLMRQLASALTEHVASHSTETSRQIQTAAVDAETEARLRALGYLVAATPSSRKKASEYTAEDDPKRLVVLSDMLDAGIAAHLAGRSDEAVRTFHTILAKRSDFTNVYVNLAYVLRETGRLGEAVRTLEDAMKRGLTTRTMLGRLGLYLQEAGRLKESVAILEYALKEDPTHAEAYNYLAVSYARMGRFTDATRALDELLKLDRSYASAYNNLGSVYLSARQFPQAEESFKRALEIDPKLAAAWNGLGVVYASTKRENDAVTAWRRSVELDPHQYDTLYNLGTLLTKLNRFSDAIPFLDQFARTAPPDRYGDAIPKIRQLASDLRESIG